MPFGATVEVLSNAWAGAPVQSVHLVSLSVTILVGGVVAAVFFRWD
ncbi:hypothetical protein [Nonomuraea longispora]|nr:hypothetical protein [Nonomuraea longispora]